MASIAVCNSPGDNEVTGLSGGRFPLVKNSTPSGIDASAPGRMTEQPRIVSSGAPSHMPRVELTGGSARPARYGVSDLPALR